MIMYIPVTKKGKVDTTRKVLSEQAYGKMLEEHKAKYGARLQIIKDDLQDVYDYITLAGEPNAVREGTSSKRAAYYTISFPYSIALGYSAMSVEGRTAAEAVANLQKKLQQLIKEKDQLLLNILNNCAGEYVKMEADVPVELEEDSDEMLCINGEELNKKFDTYRRTPEVDSSELQTIPTNSDPDAGIPDYMKIKSDGTITGIKEQN